jgi:hypothetical protein
VFDFSALLGEKLLAFGLTGIQVRGSLNAVVCAAIVCETDSAVGSGLEALLPLEGPSTAGTDAFSETGSEEGGAGLRSFVDDGSRGINGCRSIVGSTASADLEFFERRAFEVFAMKTCDAFSAVDSTGATVVRGDGTANCAAQI